MRFGPQADWNVGEIADAVATKIVEDYDGLTIGDEKHQLTTRQLETRIARCLIEFHHRQGHHEVE